MLMKLKKEKLLLLGKYKCSMNAQRGKKMPPKCWDKIMQFITKQTTCDQLYMIVPYRFRQRKQNNYTLT